MSNRQPLEAVINGEVYYKAEKAMEILQMTYSALRNQTIAGNIQKGLPSGSRQAYYRKKDVDKLAHERNISAFFEVENEDKGEAMPESETAEEEIALAQTLSIVSATETDLDACINLNRELFDVKNSASNVTLSKRWGSWIRKNPETVSILKRDDEVVGITTILPFKANSKKFQEILVGDTSILLGDVAIDPDDLEEYKAGNHVELYVAEIGVKPSLPNGLRRRYGAKLIFSMMDKVVDLGTRNVFIDKLVAVGATKRGIALLKNFGFSEITFPRQDTRVFTIDLKESGSPIAIAYREALN